MPVSGLGFERCGSINRCGTGHGRHGARLNVIASTKLGLDLPRFYSYHFKRSDGLRDSNPGLGLALKYSEASSVVFGRFRNSDNDMSNYLGFLYQPYSIGPVRLGAALAAFDGYPEMRNGKAFLSVIPTLGIHGERVALNVGVIPEIKGRVHGAVSFQLLVRFGHIPLGGGTPR